MTEHDVDPFGSMDAPQVQSPIAADGAGLGAAPSMSLEATLEVKGPTPLSKWQEQRAQVLSERRRKAEDQKATNLAAAKQELSSFYALRDDRMKNAKKQNRTEEASSKKEYEALMQFGTRWEKVNRLVNVAPKPSDKGAGRLDRMRKLLIQLKQVKDDDEKKS